MMQALEVSERRKRSFQRTTGAIVAVALVVLSAVGCELQRASSLTKHYSARAMHATEAVPKAAAAVSPEKDEDESPQTKELKTTPTKPPRRKNTDAEESLAFAYRTEEEMEARSTRFPSVKERVKLYMSNWYLPPCRDTDDENFVRYHYSNVSNDNKETELSLNEISTTKELDQRTLLLNSVFNGATADFDYVHFLDPTAMAACKHRYCKDTVEFLFPAMDRVKYHHDSDTSQGESWESSPPIVYQFGDEERTRAKLHNTTRVRYPNIPVFKKFRKSIESSELKHITASIDAADSNKDACFRRDERQYGQRDDEESSLELQPIVFKLKTQRHFSRVYRIAGIDIPWEEKKNIAVFRGELTGKYPDSHRGSDIGELTPLERCKLLPRCWLAYFHTAKKSSLVDAKLSIPFDPNNSKKIPESFSVNEKGEDQEAVNVFGGTFSAEEMLQFKVLIMLEGNDVSSGLKWALYSNSVVLMPTPTYTSWAMEELLVPWQHYIPIAVTMDDVEEKVQWVLDHDAEARAIAHQGTLWISDFLLHPQAEADEHAIFDDMLRRYKSQFRRTTRIG